METPKNLRRISEYDHCQIFRMDSGVDQLLRKSHVLYCAYLWAIDCELYAVKQCGRHENWGKILYV